jgi:mannitol/fructose-specific phosphotransferase system IIA component (Ntr-type)
MSNLSLTDLLSENQVTLDLTAQNHTEALREIVDLFATNPHVKDLAGLHAALLAREKANSTVVGNGIAFPHARTDLVDKIVLAVGRSKSGVHFENSKEPVHLIFVIGTPKALISDYLVCVGALARFVKNQAVCERLMQAKTAADFIRELKAKH